MKNSIIRRSISGVLTVAMVFSAYSCGEKKNNDSNNNSGENSGTQTAQTANEVIKNSYSSIDMDTEIPADYIDSMYYIKETSQVLIMGGKYDGSNKLYITDMDFSGFNEISLDFPEPENSQSYLRTTVSPDGYIYALLTLIDYGDFKLPDYDDPDFDYESFDFDAMYEAAEYSCILYKLSPDGQVISENELSNIDDYSSDSIYDGIHINNMVADANGNIVMAMSGEEDIYLIADENGRINGKISAGNDINYINCLTTDTEGNIFACGYTRTGSGIFTIDMNSKTFSEVKVDSDEFSHMNGINYVYAGAGDYNLFFLTRTGLYGMGDDNKPVEIVNWLDSDITPDSVQNVIGLEDGDFIVYVNDYNNNTSGFSRLTKRNPDELANQTVITVGMLYSDSAVTSKITEFNKSHTDYRIKISDYSKYNEWDEESNKQLNSAPKQLKMDIVSGNAPDMVVTYDTSLIAELAPHGTYADLLTYLEKDDDLSEKDFMPNILKASKINGKVYSLSPSFNVQTYACKTKFFDKENWTLDELIDTYHEHSDMKLTRYDNTKEAALNLANAMLSEFIDYDKAECHFDSDDFKKLLEFCNEFPDEDGLDWETATDDEMEAYWNEQETLLLEDKALLDSVYLYDFTEYGTEKTVYFNDDITFVGAPSNDGKGAVISFNNAMAILESSPSKDVCWEFIKQFFTDEYYENDRFHGGLPSITTAFEKKADASMEKPYYLDENGKKVEYDNTYWVNGHEINVKPLTQDERDFIVDYIKSADKLATDVSAEIGDILREEVEKYFEGEATSQQAIDKLQSRISILLSEQS
ncbi:MAG: extracellular solute-binding protein [Ruminococcus sp.]|nr:extracellular solute-binding protein [Ruminococcus sp.]